jgi:flavin prenyltransferase
MKLVVAITGASGSIYAKTLLARLVALNDQLADVAVIFSDKGRDVWEYEIGSKPEIIPFRIYNRDDFYAPFASGSAGYDALIVCPCSMGTLGRIAHGVSDDLVTRTADVMLKERRKLILVTRECPLSLIHINNMKLVTEAGGIICPASPSFYSKPQSIEELVGTVSDRVLQLAGFRLNSFSWGKE